MTKWNGLPCLKLGRRRAVETTAAPFAGYLCAKEERA